MKREKHGGNGVGRGKQTIQTPEPEINYTDSGFVLFSRKWLGRELAAHPGAFVVYFHLLAWANHENGKFPRGTLPIGERHFGQLVGMSKNTVKKWLRWLQKNGWITCTPTRHGSERGTIVRIVHYAESQSYKSYGVPSSEQAERFIPKPAPPVVGRSLPN